jgi:hypothetical protein
MRKIKLKIWFCLLFALVLAAGILIIKRLNKEVIIYYPFNESLFPPEFPPPVFEWVSENRYPGLWEVSLYTEDGKINITDRTYKTNWTPDQAKWESIKMVSANKQIIFSVQKLNNALHKAHVHIQISSDSVGSPILYREMPIPFVIAEKNLDSMSFRFIDIGSNQPPQYAMKGFMVCGNCHSFTLDGNTIGLDLDAGRRDKGGYFIAQILDTIQFDYSNYMSWTKLEKRKTFGLFSKLSPDGRYVVTTTKDRVIIKNFPYAPEYIAYSQLFFPVAGNLLVYDRYTHKLKELPGANLDTYVQSNAVWTPDGKNIVFARSNALSIDKNENDVNILNDTIVEQFTERKRSFKYDLYIIPFNNGNGGIAKPIEGASNNSFSNYFPAISPDGKWLIFCQAENFMLLQPDSRLYIVPIKGGKARKLQCNFSYMNSWHSWSANSKWIVFASKGLSIYTDLFLSHIDENGNASIPVLIEKARQYRKVANYPEFINRKPGSILKMKYFYVELAHIERALLEGDINKAKNLFYIFKKQNQLLLTEDYYQLSSYLKMMGMIQEARKYNVIGENSTH